MIPSSQNNPLANLFDRDDLPVSSYCNFDSLVTSLQTNSTSNSFSILSLNCYSLSARIDELNILIRSLHEKQCKIDVFCFQETWTREGFDFSALKLDGYDMIHKLRSCSKRGGLAIYVNTDIKFKKLPSITTDAWENQFVQLTINTKNYTIGNIYRPPNVKNGKTEQENLQIFYEEFSNMLGQFSNKSQVIISGDYNINLLQVQNDNFISKYLDSIFSSGYLPSITLPTRYSLQHGTASLIDNILLSSPDSSIPNVTSGIFTSGMSDHYACFVILKLAEPIVKKSNTPKFVYVNRETPERIQKFKESLAQQNILNSLDCSSLNLDPNHNYNIFESILTNEKSNAFPPVKVKYDKHRHAGEKWATVGIARSTAFRDELLGLSRDSIPGSTEFIYYKKYLKDYQRILRATIRTAKRLYFAETFDRFKNDIKSTWSTINNILNRNSVPKQLPGSFLINDIVTSDRQEIANGFNNFFVNIGSNLAKDIGSPSTRINFNDYLKSEKTDSTFQFDLVSPNTVGKIIDSLKNKASSGYDCISTRLMKQIKNEILEPITLIINQAIMTGIFPDKLKLAKVIPIYKKADERLLENYRPISLLPAISKIFEKVIHKQVFRYFTDHDLFFHNQYGFRTNFSTESATVELIDRLLGFMDKNETPFAIFMDLSKAFDTINHKILLSKLDFYGFSDPALNLLNSYLSKRYQYVDLQGVVTEKSLINTGVPQGSILGPLLFLIYMNDICHATSILDVISYADDTTLVGSLEKIKQLSNGSHKSHSEIINCELNNINDWLLVNKLSLNVAKTKYMVFYKPGRKVKNISLSINSICLQSTESFTFLGLTIDYQLTWKHHMNNICSKVSRTAGVLNRLKRLLPENVLQIIYNSLILPFLNYCLLSWGYINTDRLLLLQKKAARYIVNARRSDHCEPIFLRLKILKIDDLFLLKILKFYYKQKNDFVLPLYLKNLTLLENASLHPHFTRQHRNLHCTGTSKVFTEGTIPFQTTSLINYANERELPSRFKDFVTNTNTKVKYNKLRSKPRDVLRDIIEKIDIFGFSKFSKFCKLSLLNCYSQMCTKSPCYPCGRQ